MSENAEFEDYRRIRRITGRDDPFSDKMAWDAIDRLNAGKPLEGGGDYVTFTAEEIIHEIEGVIEDYYNPKVPHWLLHPCDAALALKGRFEIISGYLNRLSYEEFLKVYQSFSALGTLHEITREMGLQYFMRGQKKEGHESEFLS